MHAHLSDLRLRFYRPTTLFQSLQSPGRVSGDLLASEFIEIGDTVLLLTFNVNKPNFHYETTYVKIS